MFASRIRNARPTADEVSSRRWVCVPYDRLNAECGLLHGTTPADTGLVFIESTAKAARRPYHKKKLALVLANERHFALEQAERGFKILYVTTDEPFGDALVSLGKERRIGRFVTSTPAERELRQDLRVAPLDYVEDTTWMSTEADFDPLFPSGGPYRMDRFYRHMRERTGLLVQRGKPLGGKWSHDVENRKAWKGSPRPPTRPRFVPDALTREVLDLVARRFSTHFGTLDGFDLPVSAADAETSWAFARTLLPLFGPYEDAMSVAEPDLFHTKVSALLNLGRLSPARLCTDAAEDHHAGRLPLPSAEGFIRQILGWREFVRHVHRVTDGFASLTDGGVLGATRPLPPAYWGTPSGLRCLDTVVGEVVTHGFSHHITRLMILGNLATLAGYDPRQLSDWFWLAYVDAYDWVVEPNVLGMATYSDGGNMTTKPYVCGAAYIHKMSDYCNGCALDPKKSTGAGACPMTALYWTFLDRHQQTLETNPRMLMPVRSVQKKTAAELKALKDVADRTLDLLAQGKKVD